MMAAPYRRLVPPTPRPTTELVQPSEGRTEKMARVAPLARRRSLATRRPPPARRRLWTTRSGTSDPEGLWEGLSPSLCRCARRVRRSVDYDLFNPRFRYQGCCTIYLQPATACCLESASHGLHGPLSNAWIQNALRYMYTLALFVRAVYLLSASQLSASQSRYFYGILWLFSLFRTVSSHCVEVPEIVKSVPMTWEWRKSERKK